MAGVTQYSPVGGEETTKKLNHADRASGSIKPRVNRAALALNRVNMVMYPIDANGVTVDVATSVDQRNVTTSQDSSTLAKEQEARDSSKLLAEQTGGLAFFGSNDIAHALRRAMQDGQHGYTIGFYPDHGKWNGKFHELRISVMSDGARLRCRKGYFALPYQAESEKEVNVSLQQAALSPLEETDLGMIVEAKAIEPSTARSLQLRIGIDPKQLLLQDSHGEQKGAVDFALRSTRFRWQDAFSRKAAPQHQTAPNAAQYLATAGMVLEHHMIVSPEAAEINVIVRDAGSGAIGSTYLPVNTVFPTQ
jgi:hypothetical protein